MIIAIEVMKSCRKWNSYKDIVSTSYLKKLASHTLKNFECFAKKNIKISLLFTDDDEIALLNSRFRGKLAPTNVLSFPDKQLNCKELLSISWPYNIYLGDIAFSITALLNEAKDLNITPITHFAHLFIHSVLHLLGFDHESDEESKYMELYEIKTLEQLNIPNPYLNNNYQ